jgi:hypothetical protein
MRASRLCSLLAVPVAKAFTLPASSLGAMASASKPAVSCSASSSSDAQVFIDQVNTEYEQLHRAFEMQFWGTKMALADPSYSVDELTRTKGEMESFLADEAKLSQTRELLAAASVSEEEVPTAITKSLQLFEKTFGCYIMESDEAKELRAEATKIEGKLEDERNKMVLGATIDGKFEEMSSVGLRSKLRVDPAEEVREACYEGLNKIGEFVTDNGFVELVKVRNKMAKALGYLDYYDYKVTQAEGFGKEELFKILDTLEEGSRPIMEKARERFAAEKGGPSSLKPWNLSYMMAGDVTRKMDPYFPFEKSVEQWGRSFHKMNISYRGASMDLDLLDR